MWSLFLYHYVYLGDFFLEFRQQRAGQYSLQDNTQFSCSGQNLPLNCSSLRRIKIEVRDTHCRKKSRLQLLQLKIPQIPFHLILSLLVRKREESGKLICNGLQSIYCLYKKISHRYVQAFKKESCRKYLLIQPQAPLKNEALLLKGSNITEKFIFCRDFLTSYYFLHICAVFSVSVG